MEVFKKHKGIVVPLDRANIDTDVIIPKNFLKRIERTGFGKYLMYDWRYVENEKPNSEFVLNQKRYQGASILLTGENFGSGSSRENAVWALQDYGFKVIVAPNFADIFRINSSKNGLLLISLPEKTVDELFIRVISEEDYQLDIDLEHKLITDSTGWQINFEMDEHIRHKFLNGLDDITYTLSFEDQINSFERNRKFYFNPTR